MYNKFFKRIFDIILSFLCLIIFSPIFLLLALLIRIKLGSPIIFKQNRPGKNEKIFTIYKFRTMTNKKGINGEILPDNMRMTKFGNFLRSLSLDELPELFNIFIGDMSFVGPRPQLIIDMLFMSNEERERHSVKPGLTGLAQINGRNNLEWPNKIEFDLNYIKNITLMNDIIILIKTFFTVIKSKDDSVINPNLLLSYGKYKLNKKLITFDKYQVIYDKYKEFYGE